MKSLKNVRYNVYAPKAERNHATHLNRATRTVYPLGSQFKLPRGTSSLEQMRLLGHVITKQCCEIQSVGVFDFKRRCTEWSVYDIKVPREPFESIGFICSYRSRGTLMSYTDHSVQRRFKSNTPNVRTQAEHEKHCATRQSEGFSICTSPLFTMDLL